VTVLERIAAVLHRARLDGGLDDHGVAARVLAALGLTEDGEPISREPAALDG
jgi:hypothetical protein